LYEKAVTGQLVIGSGKSKKAKASKPIKGNPKLVEDVLLLPADAASEVLQDILDGKLKITDVSKEVKIRSGNVLCSRYIHILHYLISWQAISLSSVRSWR
jgi:hypothetical protein